MFLCRHIYFFSEKGILVLKDSLHPATAIECGIMDSQADMSRLRDNKQQEAMCRNILSGVGAYERESQKR